MDIKEKSILSFGIFLFLLVNISLINAGSFGFDDPDLMRVSLCNLGEIQWC